MSTPTTTIRVTRETRDLLASQAEARGISLSAMLTRLAQSETREAIFKAEREAELSDRQNPQVLSESEDWEAASGDGIE